MNKFTAVPLNLREAQAYIDELHRHHKSSIRDKFRVGAADSAGKIVGVAQCGQPINRNLNDGKTLEVLRLCTDGTKDVCSFLYAKCARIAREMGYKKIITYILESESGTSLKASGWICEDSSCGGGTWENCTRSKQRPVQLSMLPQKQKYPEGMKKQRWCKYLNESAGSLRREPGSVQGVSGERP